MSVSDIIIVYNTYHNGMWVRGLVYYIIFIYSTIPILCHLPSYITTPPNKIEQFCMLADTCVHDTIPICGRMGDEKRTFLDICDLLEFACDNNQVFTHVDDMEGCPAPRPT